MKILVDSDACPVKEIIVEESKKRNMEVIIVCDTSHVIKDGYSRVVTVDKSADSADIALINMTEKDDIVVTQDFGLAAMVIGKNAKAVNQNGMVYSNDNMDKLLFERFIGQKVRRGGGRTKGPSKRTKEQDDVFRKFFVEMLEESYLFNRGSKDE